MKARGCGAAVGGAAALVAGVLVAVALGPAPLAPHEVLAALTGKTNGASSRIVWELRLPRALVATLVGANLAAAGALLQGVMRNPLAAPDLIGVTAGAGLAATICMLLLPSLVGYVPWAAFGGAMAAALLVHALSWQPGLGASPLRMILAGVAVASTLGACTAFLMISFSDRLQSVVLWTAGSLNARGWRHAALLWPYSLAGLAGALCLARPLDLLQLGDDAARGLGVRIHAARLAAVAAAALLAAAAVSVAGLLGFVGLMAPHITRILVGPGHLRLIPASALTGALLLVWADTAARLMGELPVGILMALAGGPYFIYLLYRRAVL